MMFNVMLTISDYRLFEFLQLVFIGVMRDYHVTVNDGEFTIQCAMERIEYDSFVKDVLRLSLPRNYQSFGLTVTFDGVTNYYRIANYMAYVDDVTRLILVD